MSQATIDRRTFLWSTAALALSACKSPTQDTGNPAHPPYTAPTSASTASTAPIFSAQWKALSFSKTKDNPMEEQALLLVPKEPTSAPLLVAFHGYGESRHGLEFGARGWRDQYEMDRVHGRLLTPPLLLADSKHLETLERLEAINDSLQKNRYQGLVIACPYTPNLPDKSPRGAEEFSDFVSKQLLPAVQKEAGCLSDRASTGINGVSMGGRLSLFLGFAHPEIFGVIGSMQTAMKKNEAPLFVGLAKKAYKKAPFLLRLVSSEDDPFLEAMSEFHTQLTTEKIPHEFYVTPGPHDYIWNQGPGSIEMMVWHERVQRGFPAP
jgi:iron(III)-salmochelin esterase